MEGVGWVSVFPSPVALVRWAHDAGTGKRKAGPLWEGGDSEGVRLND